MQSPPREIKALNEKSRGLGLDTTSVEGRSSARQEAALIGPVECQIEFRETRRSEFDGLPALQVRSGVARKLGRRVNG